MEYTLTNHAKERYSERIMGRENKMDVQTFISTHEDKIRDDIDKMIEYGEVIYEGQQVRSKDTRPCKYILRNDWLVVVNPQDKKVVTLYKIDLGAGEEFNKAYISTMLNRLEDAKKKSAEKIDIIKQTESCYRQSIEDNNNKINEYKSFIKSLERQNESLNELLKEEKNDLIIAEEEIRDIIGIITTGTKF